MCETLGKATPSVDGESCFTVGLFSVLDVLAGRPMKDILAELPLSDDVKSALLNREGPLGPTLQKVLDYETNLDTPPSAVETGTGENPMMRNYLDAVAWSDTIFKELTV